MVFVETVENSLLAIHVHAVIFVPMKKISGKLLLLEPFSLVVSSQCQLPPSKKYSKVVLRRLLTTFIN